MRRCDAHLRRHPAAVFRDPGGIVVRAEAAIEIGVDAVGHAALAGEEGMTQAGNGREQRRSEPHLSSALASCFSSPSPASEMMEGSEIASTLNLSLIHISEPTR